MFVVVIAAGLAGNSGAPPPVNVVPVVVPDVPVADIPVPAPVPVPVPVAPALSQGFGGDGMFDSYRNRNSRMAKKIWGPPFGSGEEDRLKMVLPRRGFSAAQWQQQKGARALCFGVFSLTGNPRSGFSLASRIEFTVYIDQGRTRSSQGYMYLRRLR